MRPITERPKMAQSRGLSSNLRRSISTLSSLTGSPCKTLCTLHQVGSILGSKYRETLSFLWETVRKGGCPRGILLLSPIPWGIFSAGRGWVDAESVWQTVGASPHRQVPRIGHTGSRQYGESTIFMNKTPMNCTCAFMGCSKPATQNRRRNRITAWVCDEHAEKEKPNGVIESTVFQEPSTGSKIADRAIDRAIDGAMIRIKPFLRDILREEIKRMLPLEETE